VGRATGVCGRQQRGVVIALLYFHKWKDILAQHGEFCLTSVRKALTPLARLATFLAPHWLRIGAGLAALLVVAGCVLAFGRGVKLVVDRGFGSGDPHSLDLALVAMIAIVATYALGNWLRFYLLMTASERVVADLRRATFAHLVTLEPAFFERARAGELISRLTNDVTVLHHVIGSGIAMFVRKAVLMIGATVMLFVTSWKLAALVLVGAPAALLPVLFLGRRVRRLARTTQDRIAEVSAHVDEAIHGIRTLQAYAHENADCASVWQRIGGVYAAGARSIAYRAFLSSTVILISFSGIGVILWLGGHDVLAGRLTVGELAAFVFYASVLAFGAATISEVWADLQRAAGAMERLGELLDTRPRIVAPRMPAAPPERSPLGIEFDAVTFVYPTRASIAALSRFTLKVAEGERVALVGPSGAGKSTVFTLLLRFYDPQEGAVRIGGIDLRSMIPQDARRLVAVVPQEPVIFAASALENVRYGRLDATRDAVLAACERACALEFIERLPQGLDTPLGERGVTLSGGQKQRLSIARALLADRPILLLDEATSSLDAAAERLVQQGLEALEKGRTTLAIAHRLATVQSADRIVVMERGALVAQGSHAELMRQGGLYASLARLQFLSSELEFPREQSGIG
jgi:ATP-binding cassette, subfamily B, bacterial